MFLGDIKICIVKTCEVVEDYGTAEAYSQQHVPRCRGALDLVSGRINQPDS